ncbi:MAG: D-alanyl-D-alanine carboxypeptidase family protein [Chloroflexota bacterium]
MYHKCCVTVEVVRRLGLFLLLAAWPLCGFSRPALTNAVDVPSLVVRAPELALAQHDAAPALAAGGAILVDLGSGRVLFALNAAQRLPPASTTKMMTALLTLERGELNRVVTVDAVAAAEIGSRMGLAAGQQLTEHDLLYGLLLPSGNDAGMALAGQVGGSVPGFVALMNARAQQLGLTETHFSNPVGLDALDHYSSAADLAVLARFTFQREPLFRHIVGTAAFDIPATAQHAAFNLRNLNQLLSTYPGAIGIKTGTTPAAEQDLVGAAERNGRQLLVVVLHSTSRYADAQALLNYGFQAFAWWQPAQVAAWQPVSADPGTPLLLPAWEMGQASAYFDTQHGSASYSLGGTPLASEAFTLVG